MASWPPFKVGKYLGFDDGPRLPTGETEGGSRLNDLKDVELPPYSEQDDIWDVARKTLPNTLEERPTVVAVMGPTGTGKSTFISKLAGREMNIGHNLSSCTEKVEEVPCKVGDQYVILVDTPGFNDTHRSDTEILSSLADWMKTSYDQNMLLSGIIYLHSISETRMTRSSLQNLRMFRKLCGDDNLKNVILATTKWGITPEEDALRREHDLISEGGFWSTMKAAGSMTCRFEDSAASATALVEKVIHKEQKTFKPKIQEEIIQGKKLSDTDAGAVINQAIITLQKEHEKEKKALAEELQMAKKAHDRAFEEALELERQRLDKKMAEKAEEQSRLHMTTREVLQLRIKRLEESQQDTRRKLEATQGESQRQLEESRRESQQEIEKSQLEARQKRIPLVKRGFWHLRWKCRVCNQKLESDDLQTCPECEFVQRNVY